MSKRGISPEQAQKIRKSKGIEDTKLQRLRVEKGLSQTALSAKSGVTRRAIECYEQRTRAIDNAKLDTLCALCLSLDCKLEDILESKTLIERLKLCK